ncbi:MAG: DUF1801 domain-containing protein [Pyrinomonadaceae bacterium]
MRSEASTPEEYIAGLPADRKPAVSAIRDAINSNLPPGFKEIISYGMIGWVVPHELYPAGYRSDPKLPLPFISLASQKNHIALYHMGLYGGGLIDWFRTEWNKANTTHKLDIGKSCVRFKKPDDIPVDLLGRLASKMTPQQWIVAYESARRT